MNVKTNLLNRLLSKINTRGKKTTQEKAKFITEHVVFYKALTKDTRSFPKMNKKYDL